jgi:hypothetical protein
LQKAAVGSGNPELPADPIRNTEIETALTISKAIGGSKTQGRSDAGAEQPEPAPGRRDVPDWRARIPALLSE